VSRQTISTITDKVVEGMAEWQNRPLDPACFPLIVANLIERDSLNAEVRAQQDATCRQEALL